MRELGGQSEILQEALGKRIVENKVETKLETISPNSAHGSQGLFLLAQSTNRVCTHYVSLAC